MGGEGDIYVPTLVLEHTLTHLVFGLLAVALGQLVNPTVGLLVLCVRVCVYTYVCVCTCAFVSVSVCLSCPRAPGIVCGRNNIHVPCTLVRVLDEYY